MINIEIKATRRGINAVTKKLEPRVLYGHARDSLRDTLEELKSLVVHTTPVDTSQAQGNIFIEINGSTLEDLNGIVASPDPYFPVLEYGRRAGSRMPPQAPIEEWAQRHGIQGPSAVFLLRRAIAQRGLPAHHIMRNAVEQGRGHFATIWFRRFLADWHGPLSGGDDA